MPIPSPGYSITLRVEVENRGGMFALLAEAVASAGGEIVSLDTVRSERGALVRDITVNARDQAHEAEIADAVRRVAGVRVRRALDRTFAVHRGGKIGISVKAPLKDRDDLSKVYSPGVARVCKDVFEHPEHAWRYTMKGNSVAIVTDGTAVLGLGDLGPLAALPAMEGKAMIFKEFADVDAFPITLATKDPDEVVSTVINIAPSFGGINLEDISAPRCFFIERKLREALDIPVIHDDQHCTAIVVLAALINVSKLLKRDMRRLRAVICGAGAAGLATAHMLSGFGVKDIVVCDTKGAIYEGRRTGMNPYKKEMAKKTNPRGVRGTVSDAMEGADVFIGLSAPGVIGPGDVARMGRDPVVFALANPDPEISPEEAMPLARVLATGRSDYPNQINNMLGFPGIFRGLLDVRARGADESVKFAAARAIAASVKDDELSEDYIVPSIFERKVAANVAHAVAEAARKAGLARD